MGEGIQNSGDKRRRLRKVIQGLDEGSDIRKIQRDFGDLIAGTSPEEIAALEQQLMKEGYSPEDIQKVCDVHVAVFQEQLKKMRKTHALPGHPVHTFRQENREARKHLRRLRRAGRRLQRSGGREEFSARLAELARIEVHYQRKENQLFPFLEQVDFDGPSKVMWGKHDEIRDVFRRIRSSLEAGTAAGEVRGLTRELARKIRLMFFMEERILFPVAMRKLTERHWVIIRQGEPAIGYAWIRPGDTWDPSVVLAGQNAELQQREAEAVRKAWQRTTTAQMEEVALNVPGNEEDGDPGAEDPVVELSVGTMRVSQIDRMLKALPIDISFVDEEDRVRYYSDTPERAFPRSPGIIGRTVQNCHPPKSVHIVEEILRAFKAGEQDRADFWLTMNDRFLHIRYVALRDENGTFRGVLETGQDATDLRALRGERRLLEWGDSDTA